MELVKVKKNYQITIPQALRKRMRMAVGDYVEIELQEGALVIRPVKVVHPDQEYFFTPEWQQKESEADRDIAEGKLAGPFENADEALKVLKTSKT